jgi:hypothetical protein
MYAHVDGERRRRRLGRHAAREIGAALREQRGFCAYTPVRPGEWQIIAVLHHLPI